MEKFRLIVGAIQRLEKNRLSCGVLIETIETFIKKSLVI